MPQPNGPEPENKEQHPEKIYLEFATMEERAKAMEAINALRRESPEIFAGEISYKIDNERPQQGLELAFDSTLPDRAQTIIGHLHKKGIALNHKEGGAEEFYKAAA